MKRKNRERIATEAVTDSVTARPFGKKLRTLVAVAASVAMCGILAAGVGLMSACGSSSGDGFKNAYQSTTRAAYQAEYLGTVKRNIPKEMHDGGLPSGYPKFGYQLREVLGTGEEQVAARNALIREANSLTTKQTWNGGGPYEKMDQNGYLYLKDGTPVNDENGNHRQLYKHTAADGLYEGNVSDDEPAIKKRLTYGPRAYTSYYDLTGMYAPAGEIIKIEISEEDMNATNGIVVHIGQALYNGKANNIWTAKNQMNRMPVILNTMEVDKSTATFDEETKTYTAYVGSYLGGPIYVRDERVNFSVTVSGGVRYSHFILGYTTPQEFEENAKSTAPYFDLEVWDNGVLHSGPLKYAKAFSYDDLYKAAKYWDKVSLVSTKVSTQGIVFLYEPFVAAGAAVAFPGQRSVNCPSGWMSNSLNYNSLVRSGAWGNMHEYNHNYQGYGVGNGGEVTNNAMTLVEYSLFTKISAARKAGNYGAEGLGGWNRYTSATWALDQLTSDRFENGKQGLALYATLLHNFGQEAFVNALQVQRSGGYGQSYAGYFRAWSEVTHNDMSFYFNELLDAELSDEVVGQNTEDSFPTFIPFASFYQTGRSYTIDGEKVTVETMQPFQIEYGKDFTIDLNKYVVNDNEHSGSVVLPEGFDFKIKNVTKPEYGSIQKTDEKTYKFTPDKNNLRSGKIVVTVSLEATNGAYQNYKLEDFEIVLEFEQSHEMNKNMLERTTYTFAEGSVPATAAAAFESDYRGYVSKTEGDNVNKTQNCSADIWYTNQEGDMLPANSVVELSGKLHVEEDGKYRIALRGRWNVALYVSLDGGKTYESVGSAQDWTGNAFMSGNNFNEKCPYKDYELKADTWVYFKAVLVTEQKGNAASFIGVGWGKFTPPQGIIDEDGNLIGEAPESVSVAYANAFRNDYEYVSGEFTTDYFYVRDYKYTYSQAQTYGDKQTYVTGNYTPWTKNVEEGHFDIGNLFDGNSETNIHTSQDFWVSEQKPLILVVDMQETVTANSMTLYGYTESNGANIGFPSNFKLYGSTKGTELDDFTLIQSFANVSRRGKNATVTFDSTSFRYYKLEITGSDNGRVALNAIGFTDSFTVANGKLVSPDSESAKYSSGWETKATFSNFGHVYAGKKGATVELEFTGNRFGVLSTLAESGKVEVTIDGKKMTSIVKKDRKDGAPEMAFLSGELKDGNHKVTVKCTGKFNIDSFIYWN